MNNSSVAPVLTPPEPLGTLARGEVPEWPNGPVSKTGVPHGTAGSNPALSASVSELDPRRSNSGVSGRGVHSRRTSGEVSERPKEHAWKACVRQRTAGSNPALSASYNGNPEFGQLANCESGQTLTGAAIAELVRVLRAPVFLGGFCKAPSPPRRSRDGCTPKRWRAFGSGCWWARARGGFFFVVGRRRALHV